MKIRGPLVTLGAVVSVGAGMWLVNVSQQNAAPPAAEPAAAAPTSVSAAPTPTTPPAQQFPTKADYSSPYPRTTARSPRHHCRRGQGGRICVRRQLGRGLAARLRRRRRGPAREQGPNQLDRRPVAWLDSHRHACDPRKVMAIQRHGGAGAGRPLRRPVDAGRSSWIVDADGSVTGVQRRTDGSTAPAPALTSDATRVNGDTDVV